MVAAEDRSGLACARDGALAAADPVMVSQGVLMDRSQAQRAATAGARTGSDNTALATRSASWRRTLPSWRSCR